METLITTFDEWKEDALGDGWEEIPGGPWGIQQYPPEFDNRLRMYKQTGERLKGDNSVKLVKDEFVVWLVDRLDANGKRELWSHVWDKKGQVLIFAEVPEKYCMKDLEDQRRICYGCHQQKDNLKNYGALYCPECAPTAQFWRLSI